MWCEQRDWVPDGDRYYRCSSCNKRLWPKETFCVGGEFIGYRLPKHKVKGHKIKAMKAKLHEQRKRRKK